MKYLTYFFVGTFFFLTACGGENNKPLKENITDTTSQKESSILEEKCDSLSILSIEVEGFKIDTFQVEETWISADTKDYLEITFANYPVKSEEEKKESNSYNYNPQYYTSYDFTTRRRFSREKIKIVLQIWNKGSKVNEGIYQYLNEDKRVFSPFVYIKGKEYFLHGKGGEEECGILEIYKNDKNEICGKIEAKVEKTFLGEALTLRGTFSLSPKITTPKPISQ